MSAQAALLLRFSPAPADASAVAALADQVLARFADRFPRAEANRALDGSHLYLYFWTAGGPAEPTEIEAVRALAAGFAAPGEVELLPLLPVLDRPGASDGQTAPIHYVVETDVLPEVADDMAAWYAEEHLPGLAAVPGNVRARRLETVDASGRPQRSVACYDLVSTDTVKQDAWLAVRATDWSGRIRPYFTRSLRVMCEKLFTRERAPTSDSMA